MNCISKTKKDLKMYDLEKYLLSLGKVAISYSGGIDSVFLLFVANKLLQKQNVIAIIANGVMLDRNDYKDAIQFLEENEFQYKVIPFNPLEIKHFKNNTKHRCYYCKKELMNKINNVSKEIGYEYVLDGKNIDDLKLYRPGNKVAEEIGIISPLAKFGFCKKDIRKYSKEIGIKCWNKPSNSCLATRFPYNTVLTDENLEKVQLSEEIIKNLGIQEVRVRCHNDIARIEVNKVDFGVIMNNLGVIEDIKKLGFGFVTLDLEGLKSGSFDL